MLSNSVSSVARFAYDAKARKILPEVINWPANSV